MSDVVVIYTTFGTMEEAKRVGEDIVESRLAACVNILPSMVSIYEWHGEFNSDNEVVMLVKTRQELSGKVIEEIKRLHSYDTPALMVLPVEGGCVEYLNWIKQQTG